MITKGSNIRIGRVFGIPLEVSYSWFIVLILVTVLLARQFGDNNQGWSFTQRWGIGGITSILFFISVLIHELSHSLIAIKKGIPVKCITLFIFGGISQISREAGRPPTEFIIAAVGPFSSFILGAIFFGTHVLTKDVNSYISEVALTLTFVNLSLGTFNMLPGFPLDGGRVLRAIIWGITGNYWRATLFATRSGQLMALFLMGGGLIMVFFGRYQGIWLAAVGWFLTIAANSSLRHFQQRMKLSQLSAGDIMSDNYTTIGPTASLLSLTTIQSIHERQHPYFVFLDGECLGLITSEDVCRIPNALWEKTSVNDAMRTIDRMPTINHNSSALQAIDLLDEHDFPIILVTAEQILMGFIDRQTVSESLDKLKVSS